MVAFLLFLLNLLGLLFKSKSQLAAENAALRQRCKSLLLRSHWVMVVMDVFTRRIIGFGVERADLCGASLCRIFNQIIAGKSLPQHLSSDHDPLFRFHRWVANLLILKVEDIKSIPYVPVSHPFVERLIGTIRREFLDHVLIWNAVDLARIMHRWGDFVTAVARSQRFP
jgi:transposase InsO family protein